MRVLPLFVLLTASLGLFSGCIITNAEAAIVKASSSSSSSSTVAETAYSPSTAMSALWYCKSTYCNGTDISSWSCPTCKSFPAHSAVTNVKVFIVDDLQAYVAYNPTLGHIVVAFRGSANIENWIADFSFTKVPYPPCKGSCEVHHGFYDVWAAISSDVLAAAKALTASYPAAPLFVTGHSLGAAISIFAALDLATSVKADGLQLYNFGEPRVGDENFVAYAAKTLPSGHQFRVTHHEDPVPHLPPKSFGFLHTPHEVFYNNNLTTGYVECKDSTTHEDKSCSDQYPFPDKKADHTLYLGISTRCIV